MDVTAMTYREVEAMLQDPRRPLRVRFESRRKNRARQHRSNSGKSIEAFIAEGEPEAPVRSAVNRGSRGSSRQSSSRGSISSNPFENLDGGPPSNRSIGELPSKSAPAGARGC